MLASAVQWAACCVLVRRAREGVMEATAQWAFTLMDAFSQDGAALPVTPFDKECALSSANLGRRGSWDEMSGPRPTARSFYSHLTAVPGASRLPRGLLKAEG